jgi:KDO2-lipid IV(A) lauroyltransferase
MKHILRVMLESNRDNRPMCIGFISDQHPRANDQDHVTLFLNHPTAVITGPEAIARKIDMRVIYLHTVKESRGHYVTTLVPMADHAAETQKGELSDLYIRLLEQNIVENPAIWLWTHKRWKRTRKTWEKIMHERNLDSRIELAKTEDKNRLRK